MGTERTDSMRKAVASGDWPAVLRRWKVYAEGIRQEIAGGTCTRSRMAEAREFLDWARRVALCSRAQAQSRLNAIHAAQQYGTSEVRRPSLIRTSF